MGVGCLAMSQPLPHVQNAKAPGVSTAPHFRASAVARHGAMPRRAAWMLRFRMPKGQLEMNLSENHQKIRGFKKISKNQILFASRRCKLHLKHHGKKNKSKTHQIIGNLRVHLPIPPLIKALCYFLWGLWGGIVG